MSSNKKKRGQSPALSNDRETPAVRTQPRSAASPAPGATPDVSVTGRPPTGRGRRRRAPPPPPPEVDSPASLDPYHLAIQQTQSEEHAGAVMNVDASADFDMTFDDTMHEREEAEQTSAAETPTKRFNLWNPHYSQAMVVGVVALFFIVVFGYYIVRASTPMEGTEKHLDEVGLQVQMLVDSMLEEMQVAATVVSVSSYAIAHNEVNTAAFLEDINQALGAYQTATSATDTQMASLFRVHEEFLSSVAGGLNSLLVEHALDVSLLARIRQSVRNGGEAFNIIPQYDDVIEGLLLFQGRLLTIKLFEDSNDRIALTTLFSNVEAQLATVGRLFTSYLNGTSTVGGGVVRSLATRSEFNVAWKLTSMMSVSESLMRYATTNEVFHSETTSNTSALTYRTGLQRMNSITTPLDLGTMLAAEVSQSFSAVSFTWNHTYGQELLDRVPSALTIASSLNPDFSDHLTDRNTPFEIVFVTTLILLFVAAVLAVVAHIASVVHYAQNEEAHAARQKDIRTLQRSLLRMTTFVLKVTKLDATSVSAIIRKAHRARTAALPSEEIQLYSSMSTLRDKESFLPITVTRPPSTIPRAALSKAGGLFVKPALTHVKGAVAVRMSLSTFHNAFQTAGAKQKAVQHQLTRSLTAFQELADEHIPKGDGVLTILGDHAMLWMNIIEPVTYPTMRAVSIAHALKEECTRLGVRQPYICVAVGDALIGHVSSQPPERSTSNSHVTAFTSFGTIARDMNILENMSRVHDAAVTLNNAAVMSYFQDRVGFDADSLNGPHQRAVAFNSNSSSKADLQAEPSSPFSNHNESGNEAKEMEGKSVSGRGAATMGTATRQVMTLEERFRQLRCWFRPLEMVSSTTNRHTEDTFTLLANHLSLTKERATQLKARRGSNQLQGSQVMEGDVLTLDDGSWFKDYSRDVSDGTIVFPCYSSVPITASRKEEQAALAAWCKCFDRYVECCEECTADKISTAMQAASEFAVKFPHHSGPPVDRLKRALLAARNTGSISVSATALKRSRLLESLCT